MVRTPARCAFDSTVASTTAGERQGWEYVPRHGGGSLVSKVLWVPNWGLALVRDTAAILVLGIEEGSPRPQ